MAVAAGLLVAAAGAVEVAPAATSGAAPGPQVGDCVIFREGGAGLLLKTPTYWLQGTIAGIAREQRPLGLCPHIGKPALAYTPADYALLAAAMPCVAELAGGLPLTVEVLRVRLRVADWETPWSPQHGTTGWLYRGQFLDQPLEKGALIDVDAAWFERCESGR